MTKPRVWIPEIIDFARLRAAQSRYLLDPETLEACGDNPEADPDYDALAEPSLTGQWGEQDTEWCAANLRTEKYWRDVARQSFQQNETTRKTRVRRYVIKTH